MLESILVFQLGSHILNCQIKTEIRKNMSLTYLKNGDKV